MNNGMTESSRDTNHVFEMWLEGVSINNGGIVLRSSVLYYYKTDHMILKRDRQTENTVLS